MPSDYGHELTDKEIGELEARIREIYKQARDELQNTVDAYFESFWERDSEMRKRLDAGEITANDYQQWRLAQIGRGERFEALRDAVAERYTYANEVAVSYINDKTPGIYSLNHNYMAYTIEQVAGDIGFTLLDEQTVRRLISEAPDLMPHYPALRAIERGIDLAWGKKQITAAVTSGILQGNSLKRVADDLQKRIQTMERDSALRSARTALTGAECAGRQDSLSAAKKRGISVKKEWLAVADSRTRHAHAVLDGQKADVDKTFKVDGQEIMYPGDPHAKGELVYNCRCTLVGDLQGVREEEPAMRRVRNPETGENERISDMTYAEWEKRKKSKTNSVESARKNDIIRGAKGKHGHTSDGKTEIKEYGYIPKDRQPQFINDFIKQYANSDTEHMLIIDKDGRGYYVTSHLPDEIKGEAFADKMAGSYNIHTHPPGQTQFSFSTDADIPAFFADGSAVMEAVDYKYRYRFERPDVTFDEWDAVRAEVQNNLESYYDEYGVDFDNYEEMREHMIIAITCKKLGLKVYTRWKL